ncbi:phosphatidate cytidylyltransferase [Thiomicrorhabdus sp.]|uniref:phosphatidate cytidylyltransferase n=1 Tax=Thiomicrorhabdus sp. TaxID=2039724 RepID=UPI003567724D
MLKQRVITALILAIVAVAALFKASETLWQILILAISIIAAWEWSGFARVKSFGLKAAYSLSTLLLSYLALQIIAPAWLYALTVLETFVMFLVVIRYQKNEGTHGIHSSKLILLAGWLSIVLFAVITIRFRELFSAELLLLSMFVVWSMDTGAYFSGRRFGKTKLAVFVSPGKTWEGVWGGMALAFIISLFALYWLQPQLNVSFIVFAALMAIIALLSVMGDLFESVLKRQADIKDSGNILPGHGGILDRIDSLLIALPWFYILWSLGTAAQ